MTDAPKSDGTKKSPAGVDEVNVADETKKERFVRVAKRVGVWSLKWGKRAAIVLGVLAIINFIAMWRIVVHYEEGLPSVTELKGNYHPAQVTRVLARDGTLLAEIFTERRTVVSIGSLPAHVKLAVLAAEDAGFYEHEGLNYWGIARAMLVNLRSGKFRQGGSTITQQVVKNLLLDPERTFRRKIREALLARRLEQELGKDEILELYLNHIYFGDGRYGIEEASRGLFGKSAKDLTIAEAAMLAGNVAGPEVYNARKHPDKAMQRRAFVLQQMHEKGFLSDAQYENAKDEPVKLASPVTAEEQLAPEAVDIAKKTLKDLVGESAARGGYTITTSIDPRLQAAARKSLRDALDVYDKKHGALGPYKPPPGPTVDKKGRTVKPPPLKEPPFEGTPAFEHHKILIGEVTGADDAKGTLDVRVGTITGSVRLSDYARYNPQNLVASAFAPTGSLMRVSLLSPVSTTGAGADVPAVRVPLRLESGPEGAFVAVDVRTREIEALVGGYESHAGALDRATQAKRQPGSTFKPIVYSYALHARHFTPASLVDPKSEIFPGGYHPANYEGYLGTNLLTLREALAMSVNVVAVRVLLDVGPANVVQWAQSLGIESPMKPDLSLALGSYEVAPIELIGAYATFAAGGVYEEPHLVTKIVGPDGKEVELKALPPPRRVLDEAEAYVTTSMLGSVVDHGTGYRAKSLGRPLAGKTGTSNASKDTWFAGYSPDLCAVTWIGFDDGKSLGAGETGASVALPAWMDFMKLAHEHKPVADFPRPAGVVTVRIDRKTGKLPPDEDTDTMDEVFLAGTEPADVANATEDGGTQDAESD
ncbi:MAG TPA: PBP1A family penicillin-binding protein [Polyangiaceae bacterium]|nr:PBP1A family penicillin-binding protein [Polyangiaceae bacterium]